MVLPPPDHVALSDLGGQRTRVASATWPLARPEQDDALRALPSPRACLLFYFYKTFQLLLPERQCQNPDLTLSDVPQTPASGMPPPKHLALRFVGVVGGQRKLTTPVHTLDASVKPTLKDRPLSASRGLALPYVLICKHVSARIHSNSTVFCCILRVDCIRFCYFSCNIVLPTDTIHPNTRFKLNGLSMKVFYRF